MGQDEELAAMIKDIKRSGASAAMAHVETMPQGVNVSVTRVSKMKRLRKIQQLLEEDPELAPMYEDIKSNGFQAAFKYAANESMMMKLESAFGDLPSKIDLQKVQEMGGVGPLDEFYGEVESRTIPEWQGPRLLGGKPVK